MNGLQINPCEQKRLAFLIFLKPIISPHIMIIEITACS